MGPQLRIETGVAAGRELTLPEQGARLGRSPGNNDIVIDDPLLSRNHCRFFFKPSGGLWVADLDSANGTLLNGGEVGEARAKPGDRVTIGDTVIRVLHDTPTIGMPPTPAPPPAPHPPAPAPALFAPPPAAAPRAPGVPGAPAIPGFTVLGRAGEGAMAVVWRARQDSLDRPVAIKVLKPELTRDPQLIRDFIQEARAAARLRHPHIVQVYDAAEFGGICYIIMELVEGDTVGNVIRRGGPVAQKTALRIASQVADALEYAWNRERIIHRDIKPENLILDADGNVKLADLGLARSLAPDGRIAGTVAGDVEGTPHYMSPEQARGEARIDCRNDMYSLGATLYHMLTGKLPFEGIPLMEVIRRQVTDQITNPRNLEPSISLGAAQLVARLMMKDADRRYEDWGEVRVALRKVAAGGMVLGRQDDGAISTVAPPVAAEETAQPNVSAGGGGAAPVALRLSAWVLLLLWFALLAYRQLPPRPAAPGARPAPGQPAPTAPTAGLPAPDATPSTTPSLAGSFGPGSEAVEPFAPVNYEAMRDEERETYRIVTRRAATLVADRYHQDAYKVLDQELRNESSPAFTKEINRIKDLVKEVAGANRLVREGFENAIGETRSVFVNGRTQSVFLQAIAGDEVNGFVVDEAAGQTTNNFFFSIAKLDPVERSRWIGPANTPAKCAMKYLLYLERGDTQTAQVFARNAGPFSEAFAEIARTRTRK